MWILERIAGLTPTWTTATGLTPMCGRLEVGIMPVPAMVTAAATRALRFTVRLQGVAGRPQ
jgi:hypothetical protein